MPRPRERRNRGRGIGDVAVRQGPSGGARAAFVALAYLIRGYGCHLYIYIVRFIRKSFRSYESVLATARLVAAVFWVDGSALEPTHLLHNSGAAGIRSRVGRVMGLGAAHPLGRMLADGGTEPVTIGDEDDEGRPFHTHCADANTEP
jgi:hypothetical protein